MLDRVDVHCIWVSQPVLDLLPDSIPDVEGGEVVREPGMSVFCDNAVGFLRHNFLVQTHPTDLGYRRWTW